MSGSYYTQYKAQRDGEKKFSIFKTAQSATIGAAGVGLAKMGYDYVYRRNLQGKDTFIKCGKNLSSEQKKEILSETKYIDKIEDIIKNPKPAFNKAKNFIIDNSNFESIKNGFVDTKERVVKRVQSFKGKNIKETFEKVLEYTDKGKGRTGLILAMGAAIGVLLFGTSKKVNPYENQTFIG